MSRGLRDHWSARSARRRDRSAGAAAPGGRWMPSPDLLKGGKAAAISVLVCDHQAMLGDALAYVIGNSSGRFRMADDPLTDPQEAVKVGERERPDVAGIGLHFGSGYEGLEAARAVGGVSPDQKVGR